jgi:hypothetical protein
VPTLEGPAPTDADIATSCWSEPMCSHHPQCPPAHGDDRDAARVVSSHPEQGWSLLCNGVVSFEDTGELLPDGRIIAPRAPHPAETDHHSAA